MADKYVTSLLKPGERVLYEAKINRKYVSCIAFVPFLLACALTAAFIFAFERVGAVLDKSPLKRAANGSTRSARAWTRN